MSQAPWLAQAFKELGESEIPGEDHNSRILAYHLETTLKATEDEVPWCSAFLCACFEWVNVPSTRSAAARSWLRWGKELSKPIHGCVVVLKRGTSKWQGHVGLYLSETPTKIKIISGNSNDKVQIADYDKSRVIGYRWPTEEQYSREQHAEIERLN